MGNDAGRWQDILLQRNCNKNTISTSITWNIKINKCYMNNQRPWWRSVSSQYYKQTFDSWTLLTILQHHCASTLSSMQVITIDGHKSQVAKNCKFTYPICVWRLYLGWSHWNFTKMLNVGKLVPGLLCKYAVLTAWRLWVNYFTTIPLHNWWTELLHQYCTWQRYAIHKAALQTYSMCDTNVLENTSFCR